MHLLGLIPNRPRHGRKVFFIGFNKCGTKSLHKLFTRSGYRSLHGRLRLLTGKKINIAQQWAHNLAAGAPILSGLGKGDIFSDMTSVSSKVVIEGGMMYRDLHRAFPDAYFVLNTRPVEDWIQSRLQHSNRRVGGFVERYAAAMGKTEAEVVEHWRSMYLQHHEDVRAHFAQQGRFLEFCIYDDVSDLIDFVRDDYTLNRANWGHRGKSADRAAKLEKHLASR